MTNDTVSIAARSSRNVGTWWFGLCVLAAGNIIAWLLVVNSGGHSLGDAQVALSALYVFGCAYRCFLPVYDIPRIGIVDSWASSVAVGRSVATVAELAFAAQWAVYLHASELPLVRLVSLTIVPLIVVAEICSWHAVLTTCNRGHIYENSLWGIAAALIVICLVTIAVGDPTARTLALAVWAIGGAMYVAYIFIEDVPMYRRRWKSDLAEGRPYLSVAQGLVDVSRRRVVSRRWEDWRGEVVWMTLYFSFGVWVSISLI
ncbi:MAG TPA: hypothetical protein VMF52_18790 [Steroidobacteraceae bacterium]|nr:hypothetical protein [Steroidobacteraceae bacterium]